MCLKFKLLRLHFLLTKRITSWQCGVLRKSFFFVQKDIALLNSEDELKMLQETLFFLNLFFQKNVCSRTKYLAIQLRQATVIL